MTIDLSALSQATKLLFTIPLRVLQGHRLQPTGFPGLGAALYGSPAGQSLLVESPQNIANWFEKLCWDEGRAAPVAPLTGISYLRVERDGSYLTSSMTEAHRINSPYILEGADKSIMERLKEELKVLSSGPIDRRKLAETLLRYDINSLIHGVFLAKKELAGGRLRVARALAGFIEADGVQQAVSGGVKNDHVNPSGDTKAGFGNVPFSREEFTAQRVNLYINLDLAQIRGYGLGEAAERLVLLLALFKIRALVDADLRLRTACNLEVVEREVAALRPSGFALPSATLLAAELPVAIAACKSQMVVTTKAYNDPWPSDAKEKGKGKAKGKAKAGDENDADDSSDSNDEE